MSGLLPKADMAAREEDVRLGPEPDIAPPHSITSSARTNNADGKERPRALAALRLIAVTYFVGACTGRGGRRVAGFLALEDAIHVFRRAPVRLALIRPVRCETACLYEGAFEIDCGQLLEVAFGSEADI